MNSKTAFRPVALTVMLLLCLATAWADDTRAGAQQREYARDFETVWTATLQALQEGGNPVIHSDKVNGILTTDYKVERKNRRYRFSLLFVKKGETQTNVSVTCIVEKPSRSRTAVWDTEKSDGKREAQLLEDIAKRLESQVKK